MIVTYRTEFPDFGELDVELPPGFRDNSWHNDTCPCFARDEGGQLQMNISIDYKEESLREIVGPRFAVWGYDEATGDDEVLLLTDEWSKVVAYVTTIKWTGKKP